MEFTAQAIAEYIKGTVVGDAAVKVTTVCKIEEGAPGGLAFLANPKYEEFLYTTAASIVIVANDLELKRDVSSTLIRVENPYSSFALLLNLYAASKPKKEGISALAAIHASATIDGDPYVGAYAVIDSGVKIGEGAQIYPQVYVGDGVVIGRNVTLYPGVKIYGGCVLGDDVTIHGGCVIGGDGFGFAPDDSGKFAKIPQIGNVVIGNRVEIGANTCVDRATMGSTVIEDGVKLDNLIQIGHNVVIGENTVMAAQGGIAGSTKIGHNVMMGGQVGIVGHISIADNVKIGSQSGIGHNVENEGVMLLGSPAIEGLKHHRAQAIFKDLPALRTQVLNATRAIEKLKVQIEELSK